MVLCEPKYHRNSVVFGRLFTLDTSLHNDSYCKRKDTQLSNTTHYALIHGLLHVILFFHLVKDHRSRIKGNLEAYLILLMPLCLFVFITAFRPISFVIITVRLNTTNTDCHR